MHFSIVLMNFNDKSRHTQKTMGMQYQYFAAESTNTKRLNYTSFNALKVASHETDLRVLVLNPSLVKKPSVHFDVKVGGILMEYGN